MDISSFLNSKIQLPVIHLSEISRIMLDKIVHQIHLGQKARVIKGAITSKRLGPTEFPKGVDFYYIVDEIREEIENMSKIGKRYEFKIGGRLFVIYAILPMTGSVDAYKILDMSVKKMYLWLYVATYFSPTECSRELTVYLYLTEHKKKLPYKREPIDKEHANTAFTTACPIAPNNIYIFRKEEWFKVFIHETFHSLGLDFAKMPEKPANDAMFSIFPVRCDLRFYETYTEMWAEIINVIFVCLEKGGLTTKKIEDALQEERIFSLFQCVKVLNHHNIKYRELTTLKGGSRYKESTNAFSYYILKSICMFFYPDFIEWCVRKNKGTIAFLKTQPNILSLVDFINRKHNNPGFITAIETLEQWFSTTKYKGPLMDTMRMTIHG